VRQVVARGAKKVAAALAAAPTGSAKAAKTVFAELAVGDTGLLRGYRLPVT
jgi:hypothetical protein